MELKCKGERKMRSPCSLIILTIQHAIDDDGDSEDGREYHMVLPDAPEIAQVIRETYWNG